MYAVPKVNHRGTYLEQQQTENLEAEVRDVDRIGITKVDALAFWGRVIRALQSDTVARRLFFAAQQRIAVT
jgi:hypothetical protein